MGLLADERDEKRQLAAWKLGQMRAVEPLLNSLKDTVPQVRRRVAEALGNIGDDRSLEAVKTLSTDPHPEVQETAARAIAKIERAEPAERLSKRYRSLPLDALIKVLDDSDYDKRLCAVSVLGELKDSRAVEPLLNAIRGLAPSHKQHELPKRIARALGEIGDLRAVDALLELEKYPDHYVRGAARNAILKIQRAQQKKNG